MTADGHSGEGMETHAAEQVARRALALGVLVKRAEIEQQFQTTRHWSIFEPVRDHATQKYHMQHTQLFTWAQTEGLFPRYFSRLEQQGLESPLGQWSEMWRMTTAWRVESIGVLLWALGWLDEIPAYDNPFDQSTTLVPLDLLTPTVDFIWMATLRETHVIRSQRDRAELWNWRSRATELETMGIRPSGGVTFQSIIRYTAEKAYVAGHIPDLVDGDFPVFGRAYADLDDDQYSLLSSLAYERYRTLNWICELSNAHGNVRLDRQSG